MKPSFNFKFSPVSPWKTRALSRSETSEILNCTDEPLISFISARAGLLWFAKEVIRYKCQKANKRLVVAIPKYICPEVIKAFELADVAIISYGNYQSGFNVSTDEIVQIISEHKPDMILVASLYGVPIEIDSISGFLTDSGIITINDCAQTPFGINGSDPIARHGDCVVFSSAPGKPSGGVGGGYLVVRTDFRRPAATKKLSVRQIAGISLYYLARLYPRLPLFQILAKTLLKSNHTDLFDYLYSLPLVFDLINRKSIAASKRRYHNSKRYLRWIEEIEAIPLKVTSFQPDRLMIEAESSAHKRELENRLRLNNVYLGKFYPVSEDEGLCALRQRIDRTIMLPSPLNDFEWRQLLNVLGKNDDPI